MCLIGGYLLKALGFCELHQNVSYRWLPVESVGLSGVVSECVLEVVTC